MAVIKDAGDSALLLELEPVIDAAVNERAIAIAAAVRDDALAGVRDVVSTYRSVAVYFDPLIADPRDIHATLKRATETPVAGSEGRLVEIPVEYGGQWGPDLADMAAFANETMETVVRRHTERQYRVFAEELGAAPWLAIPERNAAERQIARHEEGASMEEIFAEQVRAGERVGS